MSDELSPTKENPKMEFIPFHAINEFMRSDYRMILLRSTLLALPNLSPKTQASLNKMTKRYVKVPGFRNSTKAPASVKAVAMVKPFEKEPKLVGATISAWAESNSELGNQVYELLCGYDWKLLPLDAERARLPGFLTQWPEEYDYEEIYSSFCHANPDSEYGIDDVSLMAVWLSLRLPVEKVSMDQITELPLNYGLLSEEEES